MSEPGNGRKCATCLFFISLRKGIEAEGECREDSPQVQMIPIPRPVPGAIVRNGPGSQEINWKAISFFPPTNGNRFCFKWKSALDDALALAEGQDLVTGAHG